MKIGSRRGRGTFVANIPHTGELPSVHVCVVLKTEPLSIYPSASGARTRTGRAPEVAILGLGVASLANQRNSGLNGNGHLWAKK